MHQALGLQSELQSYVRTQASRYVPTSVSQAHKHQGTCFPLIPMQIHHPTHQTDYSVTVRCYLATLCIIKLLWK